MVSAQAMLSNMTTFRLQDKQSNASQLRWESMVDRPFALLAPPSCTVEHCRGAVGLIAILVGGGVISNDHELELPLLDFSFFSDSSSESSNSSSSLMYNMCICYIH